MRRVCVTSGEKSGDARVRSRSKLYTFILTNADTRLQLQIAVTIDGRDFSREWTHMAVEPVSPTSVNAGL